MLHLTRTTSDNPDFTALVQLLDQDLQVRDGDDHAFYAQFNKVDKLKQVLVAHHDGKPVGCGAIRALTGAMAEVKRMFVQPEYRGQGVAQAVLAELERWAQELGSSSCVLETGRMQPEAIRLYQKCGYAVISNYGQYEGVENSVCFQKIIDPR